MACAWTRWSLLTGRRARGSSGGLRPASPSGFPIADAVLGLYVLCALALGVRRGCFSPYHRNFPIFRSAFFHLLHHQNLYAAYPAAQGPGPRDLFKYSPVFAFLFAPFALVPFPLGVLLWSTANALSIYAAVRSLLPEREAALALLLMYPEVWRSVQAVQSNCLVAALIVSAFVLLERRRPLAAASAIAAGTLVKVFPLAAATFGLLHRERRRFAAALVASGILLAASPLLVSAPAHLAAQYRWWFQRLAADAADLDFGRSVMHLFRQCLGLRIANWPFQLAGSLALVAPVLVQRERWRQLVFRRCYLSSVLVFVTIFNHQVERSSFVIAATGVCTWYAAGRKTVARTAATVLCLAGLYSLPCLVAWLWMQADLYRGGSAGPGNEGARQRSGTRPSEARAGL